MAGKRRREAREKAVNHIKTAVNEGLPHHINTMNQHIDWYIQAGNVESFLKKMKDSIKKMKDYLKKLEKTSNEFFHAAKVNRDLA